ncbi:MAG: DUF2007 domain-containing protein [Desulfobacterales bacterium]|nr:DUF2007 domain-containing protein [Desulfobacterales bacterium]
MEFQDPLKIYTAASNIEAHMIVDVLEANGIAAFADEDQTGVSVWAFGTISQFHLPNIWIDRSTAAAAAEVIRDFEERKRRRENSEVGSSQIVMTCEKCGKVSSFPNNQNGTVQECSHCHAYLDVGELEWSEDFGDPEGQS